MRILGFSGKSGTGKTTLAKYIQSFTPYSVVHAFAAPIKKIVTVSSDYPLARRKALQEAGDKLRARNPLFMIEGACEFIEHNEKMGIGLVIFDDIRRPEEAQMIRNFGGTVIHLEVPEIVRVGRLVTRDGVAPDDEILKHNTESSFDQVIKDYSIWNNDLEDSKFIAKWIAKMCVEVSPLHSSWKMHGVEEPNEKKV